MSESKEYEEEQLSGVEIEEMNSQFKEMINHARTSLQKENKNPSRENILEELRKIDATTRAEADDPGNYADFGQIMECMKVFKEYSNNVGLTTRLIAVAQGRQTVPIGHAIQRGATLSDPTRPRPRPRIRQQHEAQNQRSAPRVQPQPASLSPRTQEILDNYYSNGYSNQIIEHDSESDTSEGNREKNVEILKTVQYYGDVDQTREFYLLMGYKAPNFDHFIHDPIRDPTRRKIERVGDFYHAEFRNFMRESDEQDTNQVEETKESKQTIPFCGISVKTTTLIFKCLNWMKNNAENRENTDISTLFKDEEGNNVDTTLVLNNLMNILLMSPITKGQMMKYKTKTELKLFSQIVDKDVRFLSERGKKELRNLSNPVPWQQKLIERLSECDEEGAHERVDEAEVEEGTTQPSRSDDGNGERGIPMAGATAAGNPAPTALTSTHGDEGSSSDDTEEDI